MRNNKLLTNWVEMIPLVGQYIPSLKLKGNPILNWVTIESEKRNITLIKSIFFIKRYFEAFSPILE